MMASRFFHWSMLCFSFGIGVFLSECATASGVFERGLRDPVTKIAGYLREDAGISEIRIVPAFGMGSVARAVESLLAELKIQVTPDAAFELHLSSPDLAKANAQSKFVQINLAMHHAIKGRMRQYKTIVRGESLVSQAVEAIAKSPFPTCRSLAGKLWKWLDENNSSEISIRPFGGAGNTGHGGLALSLKSELDQVSKKKFRSTEGAKLTFHCEYVIGSAKNGILYKFEGVVRDEVNKKIAVIIDEEFIGPSAGNENTDVVTAGIITANFTGEHNPRRDNKSRMQDMFKEDMKSTAFSEKNITARSSRNSPFGVRLIVNHEPRAILVNNGKLFSNLKLKEEYSVGLINESDYDVAVSLWIDGLSMFHFSEEGRAINLLIPKRTKIPVEIPGWFFTREKSARFQIMSFGNTPAGKLLVTHAQVGTITAVFAHAYGKKDPIPEDESALNIRLTRGDDVATGIGRKVDAKYEPVERLIGAVRASVTVRYTRPQ